MGMLGIYLALMLVGPFLLARAPFWLHILNGLQTLIPLTLLLTIGDIDYFSLLFIPPCTQSILNLPRRTALIWIGVIIAAMSAALLMKFPLTESIGFVIIYPTAIFLFTALSYLAKQAMEAQNRSEALLADLQKANTQLQEYAIQVQELAVTRERNRLARELHDSVTQIIFGLTLSAQAARILLDRNPARVAAELDHLQTLAQNALAEMRALVQELHPHPRAEETLPVLITRLAAELKASHGLTVDVRVAGERLLPQNMQNELCRITQEALNNIVKHAKTSQASVTLDLTRAGFLTLLIEDQGIGFNTAGYHAQPGHLGLISMQERVESLGGSLSIQSQPGQGTRIRVEIALEQEVEHAG